MTEQSEITAVSPDGIYATPIGGAPLSRVFHLRKRMRQAEKLIQFIWTWNDPLIALDFAPGSSAPLNVNNRSLMRESGTNIVLIALGRFISMIIPVVVFFVFQRYFVEGLVAGSIV